MDGRKDIQHYPTGHRLPRSLPNEDEEKKCSEQGEMSNTKGLNQKGKGHSNSKSDKNDVYPTSLQAGND